MMVLAALPGMERELLVSGNLAKPGNFSATVNLLDCRIGKVGLGRRGDALGSGSRFLASPCRVDLEPEPDPARVASVLRRHALPPDLRRTAGIAPCGPERCTRGLRP